MATDVAWTGATAVSVRAHALRMRVTPAGWPTAVLGRTSYAPMTSTHLVEAERNVVPIGPWPAGETTIAVPDYGGVGFHVAAHGVFGDQDASAWASFAACETFESSLSAPPVLVSPAADASGVTTRTPFSIMENGEAVYPFQWKPTIAGSAPAVTLTTTSATAYLPDVAALGVSLAAGNNHFWYVTSIDAPDLATAARVAGVDGFALGMGGPAPGTWAGMAAGEAWRFTLAP